MTLGEINHPQIPVGSRWRENDSNVVSTVVDRVVQLADGLTAVDYRYNNLDCTTSVESFLAEHVQMHNARMQEKLAQQKALDVAAIGEEIPTDVCHYPIAGTWLLRGFIPDIDYCCAKEERWIHSIGRSLSDGRIFAAYDKRFYDNREFECLWLR